VADAEAGQGYGQLFHRGHGGNRRKPNGKKTRRHQWRFLSPVSITNSGFKEDGDKLVSEVLDSKGGFTWVLAGAKAWLEHGINLNLIADAFPKGLRDH
jgi:hypothetical protein